MLLVFGLEPEFAEVGIGDGAAELVVILAAIQRALDVLTQGRGIDVVQQIQTANDMVIFLQGATGFVFAGIGIEFPHDNALGRGLEGQGDEDPQQIGPFLNDEAGVDFPDGLEQPLAIVAGMPKAIEGGPDGIIEIAVARCELIAKRWSSAKLTALVPCVSVEWTVGWMSVVLFNNTSST